MNIELTKEEINVLLQYISFMDEFDDDPDFRNHAITAEQKLEKAQSKQLGGKQ